MIRIWGPQHFMSLSEGFLMSKRYLSKSAHAREHFLLAKWSSLSVSSLHNHNSIHFLTGLGLLASDDGWVLALSRFMLDCLKTLKLLKRWTSGCYCYYQSIVFDIQQPNVSSNCKDRPARVSYEKLHIRLMGQVGGEWFVVVYFPDTRQTLTLSSIISKPLATNFYTWKPITEQVS